MMPKFTDWLKRHTGVHFALKCIRQFYNYDFREYVLAYRYNMRWREFALPVLPDVKPILPDANAMHFAVWTKGTLNPNKIIYEIPMDTAAFGFCSQLTVMLNRVNFADEMGFAPCINWYESMLYKEKEPVHGTTNIFEYYFEPIQGVTVEEAEASRFVIYDDLNKGYGFNWSFIPLVDRLYDYTERDIARCAELMKKYFRLRKEVKANMDKEINSLLKKRKILGVHGRGGDIKIAFLGHPVNVSGHEYIETAEKAMKKIKADYVFLATDDLEILESFKKHFGKKLLYFRDVVRTRGRLHNALIEVEREQHRYKLGFEILRDVYALANCAGLITGFSAINAMSRIIKKVRGEEFEYQEIIDKGRRDHGVNVNNPNFIRDNAVMVAKIKAIQARKDISEKERQALIEQLFTDRYGTAERVTL